MLLIYLPTLAAAYELGLTDFFTNPGSRGILSAPTIIAYIVVLGPILAGLEPIVIRSLRPNILVDDQELARIIQRASAVSPLHEAAAIATGLFFGFLIIGGVPGPGESWPTYVWLVTGYVMLGLLGWIGFLSIAGTRVVSQLLRQPMRVDPLDLKPFEAIGRQSLALTLVIVGGISLGLLLGSYGTAALLNPRFWMLFLPLSLVPLVVFSSRCVQPNACWRPPGIARWPRCSSSCAAPSIFCGNGCRMESRRGTFHGRLMPSSPTKGDSRRPTPGRKTRPTSVRWWSRSCFPWRQRSPAGSSRCTVSRSALRRISCLAAAPKAEHAGKGHP